MQMFFYAFEVALTKTKIDHKSVWNHMVKQGRCVCSFGNSQGEYFVYQEESGCYVGVACSERSRKFRTGRRIDKSGRFVYPIKKNPKEGDWGFNFFLVQPDGTRGIYAHYQGALSLRRFDKFMRRTVYSEAVKDRRKTETAKLRSKGLTAVDAKAKVVKSLPLHKTFSIGPIIRKGKLDELLKKINEFSYFAFTFPEIDDDPFSNARSVASSVQSTIRFTAKNQNHGGIINAILDLIRENKLKTGTVHGKNTAGTKESVKLNEQMLALGARSVETVLPDGQLDLPKLSDSPILPVMHKLMRSNSDMFSAPKK